MGKTFKYLSSTLINFLVMRHCIFLSLLIVVISCNSERQNNFTKSETDSIISPVYTIDAQELGNLLSRAIDGDTSSYLKARQYYILNAQYDKFLYCSLIMANKYNYQVAFYDVYFTLSHPPTGGGFDSLDKNTKNLALYFLLKSHELGYQKSIYDIEEIFKETTLIKPSKYYLSLIP